MGVKLGDKKQAKKSYLQYHRVCPENGLEVEELSLVSNSSKAGHSWSDLPHPLLETIFSYACEEQGRLRDPRVGFILSSVCRSWRAAASSVFFRGPWLSGNAITHPAQLFQLCPLRLAPGGTIKCYLKREVVSGGFYGRLHRFILCQGSDYTNDNGKFLLAALQQSKQRYSLYLQRNLSGPPAARLVSDMMRTGYTLIPSGSGWVRALITGQHEQLQQHQDMAGLLQLQPLWPHVSGTKRSSDQGYCTSKDAAWWDLPCISADSYSSSSMRTGPMQTGTAATAAAAGGGDGRPLACVRYKLRVRGMMLPRSMTVRLPCPLHHQQHHALAGEPANACFAEPADDDQGHHNHEAQQQQQQHSLMGLYQQSSWWPDGLYSRGKGHNRWRQCSSTSSRRRRHFLASLQQQEQEQQLCTTRSNDAAAEGAAALLPPCRVCGTSSPDPGSMKLRNKPPHWNEGLRCWCLNFRGRVKLASVKNFQLMAVAEGSCPDASNSLSSGKAVGHTCGRGKHGRLAAGSVIGSPATWGIAMQFGKVDTDLFILDYDPCLVSAVQAFAVALTTFETKLLL